MAAAPIVTWHGVAVVRVGRKIVVVIAAIHGHRKHQLFALVQAHYALCPLLALGKNGQQQSRQNADDSNRYEQLYQSETWT